MQTLKVMFLLAGLAAAGAAIGQQATAPFFLSISLPKSSVNSGSNLEVDIEMKNVSTQDLQASKIVGTAEADYEIIVTDSAGKSAAETKYGRMLHGKEQAKDHHSWVLVTLKPGETMQEH